MYENGLPCQSAWEYRSFWDVTWSRLQRHIPLSAWGSIVPFCRWCLFVLIGSPSFLHSLAFCFLGWKWRWELGMSEPVIWPIYFCVLVIKQFCTQRDTKVSSAFFLCLKLLLALRTGRSGFWWVSFPGSDGERGVPEVPAAERLPGEQPITGWPACPSKHRDAQFSSSHKAMRSPSAHSFWDRLCAGLVPSGTSSVAGSVLSGACYVLAWCKASLSHWPSVLDWFVNLFMSVKQ